jgi:cell division protein WhiA
LSLSEELRAELAAVRPARPCCRVAEISGLFHAAGTAHLRGRGETAVHVDLSTSAVARRAFSLLRDLGVPTEIRTYRQRALGRVTRYQLHVSGSAPALRTLSEAGVVSARGAPLERPPLRVVGRACCRGAYLRGALLGAGSLSGPRAAHLEIRAASLEGARFVASVAARVGAPLAVRDRGTHAAAYAKGAEPIEQVLAAAGAGGVVLRLEEGAVLAATRARANRLANADHANVRRAAGAADTQLRALARLNADGRLETLPRPLREAADLRVRYPSHTLADLARHADVSKPTLHRRLSRLVELAGR